MGQLAERQRPFRREEYERMSAAGFFRDERVELLRGVIVIARMGPQNTPHANGIEALTQSLLPPLVGRANVRVQLPFAAGDDSLPEPDLAVVKPGRYMDAHPDQAFLIIEVADASLKIDRQEKAEIYARAGVPEYWVVNVAGRTIERHSEPTDGTYARVAPFRSGETVQPLAFPDVAVRVDDVFGGGRDLQAQTEMNPATK
jgi:Uma2 family endonuclease